MSLCSQFGKFAFATLLISSFVASATERSDKCDPEKRVEICKLFINEESDNHDLTETCKRLHNFARCVEEFYDECMTAEFKENPRNKFSNIIPENIRRICFDDDYQKDFLRYRPCHSVIRDACHETHGNYQIYLNQGIQVILEHLTEICSELDDYMSCFRATAKDTCVHDAAIFVTHFESSVHKPMGPVCQSINYTIFEDDENFGLSSSTIPSAILHTQAHFTSTMRAIYRSKQDNNLEVLLKPTQLMAKNDNIPSKASMESAASTQSLLNMLSIIYILVLGFSLKFFF